MGPRWVPKPAVGLTLVVFPFGIAYQLEAHAPWRDKIDPSLSAIWAADTYRGLTEYPHASFSQVGDGFVDVVYVERKVDAADIAVAGGRDPLIGRPVFNDLEVRTIAAA